MQALHFATGNPGKISAAKQILRGYTIQGVNLELEEIQSTSLEEVAKHKVMQGFQQIQKPIFCDDSGIFLDAYGAFPGVYTADIWKQLREDGFRRLMHGVSEVSGSLKAVIAYMDETLEEPMIFSGEDVGKWDFNQKHDPTFSSLPFDSYFFPDEFNPDGQMHVRVVDRFDDWENGISHRARAMGLFYEFLRTK